MKGGQVSPEATMALNEMRQRTSAQEYGRFILEALKSTGLVGRPFNETPIGQAASLRGLPLGQQLAVSENDPAFGFVGSTTGKVGRDFVTLYHGTTKAAAEQIAKTGVLKSAGEPSVYLTTDKTGGGYGDGTVVAVRVPKSRLILDDEFPGGRQDYRIDLDKPGGWVKVDVVK